MLALSLPTIAERPLRLLCLGAHPDDIEIGASGFISQLMRDRAKVDVSWVVFSGVAQRRAEAEAAARALLAKAHHSTVVVKQYQDGFFPASWADIKRDIESLKSFEPDIVLTHYREDRHQDHKTLSDLTWNAFRDHLILEYEVPKFDGDLGSPNVFVGLTADEARDKCAFIEQHFESQRVKHWFSAETLMGIMRIRGMETGRTASYAEGFYLRKAPLSFGSTTARV